MPRYYFDHDDGRSSLVDEEGVIIPLGASVDKVARQAIADIAADDAASGKDLSRPISLTVREANRVIIRLSLSVLVSRPRQR